MTDLLTPAPDRTSDAAPPDPVSERQATDAAVDEYADETRDAGGEEAGGPSTNPPTLPPATPPADVPAPAPEDPYDLDRCTITVVLQFLPKDDDPQGRQVLIGVRNPIDPPMIQVCRQTEIDPLPAPVQRLLDQFATQLPALKQAAEQRQQDAAAVAAARPTVSAAPSKSKSGATNQRPQTQTSSSSLPNVPRAQPVVPTTPDPRPPNEQNNPTQLSLFG